MKTQHTAASWQRWELLILLFLAYFLNQADRALFGIVLPSLKAELALSDTQVGLCSSTLFLVLALMVPMAGFFGDRFSKKWIITVCLIFWSVATMFTGLATGVVGLIVFRSIATGGGESFYMPAATTLIAANHHKTRALALSIHQSSLYIGMMISGFLGGWISGLFGWRSSFYCFGALGILLGIVLIFRLRDPRDARTDASDSRALSPLQALRQIVRIPTLLLLTVGCTAIVFVNNAFLTWAPLFIGRKFHLSETAAGGFCMLYHHLAALAGVLLGGFLSDKFVRRRPSFRLQLQSAAMLLGVPLIFMIGRANSLNSLWTVLFVFGWLRGLYESNTHAAIFDVVPAHIRATVVGLVIMTGFLLGSLSPLLLGFLGDRYGTVPGLESGFSLLSVSWLVGGLCLLAALLFTFKKDRIQEHQNDPEVRRNTINQNSTANAQP